MASGENSFSTSDLLKNLNSYLSPTGLPKIAETRPHSSSFLILKITAFGSENQLPRVNIHRLDSPVRRKVRRASTASVRKLAALTVRKTFYLIWIPVSDGSKFTFSQFSSTYVLFIIGNIKFALKCLISQLGYFASSEQKVSLASSLPISYLSSGNQTG